MKKAIMMTGVALATTISLFAAPKKKSQCELEVPYLSIYYVQPQVTVNEDVKISFYVSDWMQSEYRLGDDSHLFGVLLRIWKKGESRETARSWTKKKIKAGDHTFTPGKFDEGEYIVELSAIDQYKRKSHVLFHEFRVKKDYTIREKETYRMTVADLKTYGISNTDDLGIFHFIDAKDKDEKTTAALVVEEAKKVKVPSGKYVVVAGAEKYVPAEKPDHRGARNVAEPEWLPNIWSWRSCKVLYADDYNKAQVETNAVANSIGINKLLNDIRKKGYRKLVMLPGRYRMSHLKPINIPSGLTWDLNGATIKLNQYAGCKGSMINMLDCYDSHLVNGIVEGDYFEHDYKNSTHMAEWVLGFNMEGNSKYCSVERVHVRYVTGYGVHHGFKAEFGNTPPIRTFKPGTIDEVTGEALPDVEGLAICDPIDVTTLRKNVGYLTISRWLGYQGLVGDDWSCRYHFYDKNGKYLETIRGRQYRRVIIPEKAQTVRATIYASADVANKDGLRINLPKIPWNSWYKDVFLLSIRCVGFTTSAMYNFRIENCSVARSGENLARCGLDAEDGWDTMQDMWIVRNKFFKNPYNEILTCLGHNIVVEDNDAHIHIWHRTNGCVVRNNVCNKWSGFLASGNRADTGCTRIYDNTYTDTVLFGDHVGNSTDRYVESLRAVDPDQWVTKKEKKDEASAKNKSPIRKDWFIVMKDIDKVPQIRFGRNAILYKQTIRNQRIQRLAAAESTIEDCKNMQLNGSIVTRSKVKNFSGLINNNTSATFIDSELENGTISIHAGGTAVVRGCHLKNVVFDLAYWHMVPRKLVFENCTFDCSVQSPIRTPVFGIEEFKFVNCTFINDNKHPVVHVTSMNKNKDQFKATDEQPGKIIFEKCKFKGWKKTPLVGIGANINAGSKKKITVINKGSKLKVALVHPTVPWWTVSK